jgi:hypothetical protein
MRKLTQISIVVWIAFVSALVVLAQDAVPTEILERTIFIKAGTEAGTAFSVDYQGKVYLVTARHVVTGLPVSNATIQVWQSDQWKDYHTVKTIFPSSGDVDIAIFETEEKVAKPYEIKAGDDTSSATMGQQVWFLGYPWGIANRRLQQSWVFWRTHRVLGLHQARLQNPRSRAGLQRRRRESPDKRTARRQ